MVKEDKYKGSERRQFLRLDYVTPLAYKICKEETIHKLLQGYTSNISPAGLLCNIKEKVKKDDILWLSFDRDTLSICKALEKRSFIYQNGVIGKVARVEHRDDNTYDTGIQFITRKEKDSTHIYPKSYFTQGKQKEGQEEEQEEELLEQKGEEREEQEERGDTTEDERS
jgi:hypothetical protein